MTDEEINKIVSKLLRERLNEYGFVRSSVQSEEDFDGSSILRVTAYFKKEDVPSDRLTDALHEIRSKLLDRGEERFVFLRFKSPREETIDEDVE
jgi:hypothetical protein